MPAPVELVVAVLTAASCKQCGESLRLTLEIVPQ
jgi:hypothetical protein